MLNNSIVRKNNYDRHEPMTTIELHAPDLEKARTECCGVNNVFKSLTRPQPSWDSDTTAYH